ncbi:MAG: hypothetical protein Q8K59_12880 [Nitrosomonas sp.]|nr:hypothetical protein [Nitrosomonas sp.]MDP1951956.1 hypothetical protein [Nitrosomonas sp.]
MPTESLSYLCENNNGWQRPYKVIDVFAGPGGLGEGFAAFDHGAGKPSFKLALSIEKDPDAHSTLLLRSFYRQFDPEKIPPEYWFYAKGEITKAALFDFYPQQAKAAAEEAQCIELGKTPAHEVKSLISQRLNDCEKWVLVGGPPCQVYSLGADERSVIRPTAIRLAGSLIFLKKSLRRKVRGR